jgi:glycosyltransferase involved in cell wall biosynthesis
MRQDEIPTETLETEGQAGSKPVSELSAMMPAYNEETALPAVLQEAVEALEAQCATWELVMVDDGSSDRTPQILAEWAEKEPRIRVVTQPRNLGYSKALARGFDSCRYEALFYTDADAQFDLNEIVNLYPLLAEVDMVSGYRVGRQDPAIRHLTSAVYNRLQGWLLGIKVRDVNCAFKLFRKSFFEKVRLKSDGFLVDAEIYARAKRAGLTWKQVGVRHRPRELGSTTVKVATVTETLRELWALRRTLKQEAS